MTYIVDDIEERHVSAVCRVESPDLFYSFWSAYDEQTLPERRIPYLPPVLLYMTGLTSIRARVGWLCWPL